MVDNKPGNDHLEAESLLPGQPFNIDYTTLGKYTWKVMDTNEIDQFELKLANVADANTITHMLDANIQRPIQIVITAQSTRAQTKQAELVDAAIAEFDRDNDTLYSILMKIIDTTGESAIAKEISRDYKPNRLGTDLLKWVVEIKQS